MAMRRNLPRCVGPVDCEPAQQAMGGCRVAAQGLFFKPQGFDPVTHISAELDEVVLVDPSRAARIV